MMNPSMERYAGAYDRLQDHFANMDPMSKEDMMATFPLQAEHVMAQLMATLDIKTRHDLMKSSIDAIR